MAQMFQTIEAGIDVCSESVQMSYLNLEKKLIGDLSSDTFSLSREAWQAFVDNPENVHAASPIFQMLDALKKEAEAAEISRIVLTVPKLDRPLVKKLEKIAQVLGFSKDQIRLISRSESMIHYILHQKRDLWLHQVQVYDFDCSGLYVRKLTIEGIRLPKVVRVEEKQIADASWYKLAFSDPEELDRLFGKAIQEEMRRSAISSVYLIGDVFSKDWLKKSLHILCDRKKVFVGQNLYAQGSCYSAMRHFGRDHFHDYRFDCEGRTKIDIGILVQNRGRKMYYSLSEAGTYWHKASGQVTCLLDQTETVDFELTDPYSKYSRILVIDMSMLPKRPNKTTRVQIDVECLSDNEYMISVTDIGFGDFFEGSFIKQSRLIRYSANGFEEV